MNSEKKKQYFEKASRKSRILKNKSWNVKFCWKELSREIKFHEPWGNTH